MKKREISSEVLLDTPLFCRISESNKKWLVSYVYDKFGTSYALSKFINDLISDFRDTTPVPAHTHMKKEAMKTIQRMRMFFASYPEFDGIQRIVDSDLKTKIGEYFGIDSRTRKKYFDAMIELGILKNPMPVQGGRRIIFEVDLGSLGMKKPLQIEVQSSGGVK